MKFSKITILSAVTAFAAIAAFGTGAAQAATCSVPSLPYPTIQSAVNDPSCTQINVAPGGYTENVTVGRTVAIYGAQAATPYATRVSGGPLESTVNGANPVGSNPVFLINAAGVIVDGFTIKNFITTSAAIGVLVKVPGNDAMVTNNIIDMIISTDTTSDGTGQGVYLENGADNVNISDNEMKNIHGNRSTKGVFIGDSTSANPSVNILIKGNSIHDVTSDAKGAYGILINNGNGSTMNNGLEIRNNTFDTLTGGGWAHAIGLEANTPGVMVVDNDVSNLTDLTPSPFNDSIAVLFEANPTFASAQVHTNNFNLPATSYGIAVNPTIPGSGSVNGTCNWWNSPTGPTAASNPGGTGAQVSPRVTYTPWLTAPAPSNTCGGGLPHPTTSAQCKNGGWQTQFRADGSTFKNQGDCIQYVNTGH